MKYLFYLASLFTQNDVQNLPTVSADSPAVDRALRIVFGIAGGVALVIITIAGLKYVTSQGKPEETARAKDTILYALIGLVVIILSYTILAFVIGRI